MNSFSYINNYEFYEYIIILIIILVYSSYKSIIKGRKVRPSRLFIRPLFYIFLSLSTLSNTISMVELISILIGSVTGFLIAYYFGEDTKLFIGKNNDIYYKRSPVIFTLWILSFLGRIYIYFISENNITWIEIIFDFLLLMSTFMTLGESFYIYKKYRILKQYIL